jgi:hypothetical protein
MLEKFQHAIHNKLKVRFKMTDTPADKDILLHPHAIVNNLFDGTTAVAGYIELHHTGVSDYWRLPNIDKVTECIILNNESFDAGNWKAHVDLQYWEMKQEVKP